MKKMIFPIAFVVIGLTSVIVAQDCDDSCEDRDYRFTSALTAGFVFKHDDCTFKEVYGHGIANLITADNCYYFWKPLGVGAKVSYWRAHGCTTLLKQRSLLQEVPLTFYLRAQKDFDCGVQLYASLGGGVIWLKENSYLACVRQHNGIGEVEAGLNYSGCGHVGFTAAFRYLFPPQSQNCTKVDIGGFDLRAGIIFLY